MTNVELIAKLKQLPADATVTVWDINDGVISYQVIVEYNNDESEILITT